MLSFKKKMSLPLEVRSHQGRYYFTNNEAKTPQQSCLCPWHATHRQHQAGTVSGPKLTDSEDISQTCPLYEEAWQQFWQSCTEPL